MSPTPQIQRLGHAFYRIVTPGGRVVLIDPWVEGNPSLAAEWQDTQRFADTTHVLLTNGHFGHVMGVQHMAQAAPGATFLAPSDLPANNAPTCTLHVTPPNTSATSHLVRC